MWRRRNGGWRRKLKLSKIFELAKWRGGESVSWLAHLKAAKAQSRLASLAQK
jgi:hypothetical protein